MDEKIKKIEELIEKKYQQDMEQARISRELALLKLANTLL